MIGSLSRDDLDEARELLIAACSFDPIGAVAEEKLFGAAPPPHATSVLGARAGDGKLVGIAVVSGRWLRLLAVAPAARRRGVGQALLDAAATRAGAKLRTCDQPGNYLAPGIDTRNVETIAFFAKRGFRETARYENLAVPLDGNPKVTRARAAELAAAAARRGYTVRRAAADDAAQLLGFAQRDFAPVWAFELARALDNRPPAVHIALAGDEVVAFACHDGNNRGLGWFGPAGTAEAHRGHGLGGALLLPCLLDVADAGHRTGVIAWIGPRAFYEKEAGAHGDRSFVVLEKELA